MKPYVICHMASSIDGRIVTSRWRPEGHDPGPSYERLHTMFDADAWLIGRTTGQDYAKMDRSWGRSDIGGNPLVVVLCDHVSDAHTAGLPADGVSCIFAGRARLTPTQSSAAPPSI